MFSRPQYQRTAYQPYQSPRFPRHSAGFRMPNPPKPCFNPFPQVPTRAKPSPLFAGLFGSPHRGANPFVVDDNAPPTQGLPLHGFGVPPPTPVSQSPPMPRAPPPTPNAFSAHNSPAPANPTAPPSSPPPRKKYGPKRLSFSRHAAHRRRVRNGPHRKAALRAQEKKGRRQLPRHERLEEEARIELATMADEIYETMQEDDMTDEDRIFMEQFNILHLDHIWRNDLIKYRDTGRRAAEIDDERAHAHAQRDCRAARLLERRRLADAVRAEKLAQEKQEAEERARAEELAAAKRRMEEMKRWEEDRDRRRRQEEHQRRERERRAREEEARRAEQQREELRKAQEAERVARERAAQEQASIVAQFQLYDAKWLELKINQNLPPVFFAQLPWPLLDHPVPFSPDYVTYERMQAFVFHPARPGMEGKSRRDRVKADMLKYHPDKFNSLTLGKVTEYEQGVAAEVAGVVARLLTRMMGEEIEREKRAS